MKITMLGYTGSGKTCYMLGMYALMSMGINGFTLTAIDPDEDLQLMELWEGLVDGNILPPPTQPQSSERPVQPYNFSFNYGAKPLIDFHWIDYRGGALKESSSQSETHDSEYLREAAKASDCLFLIVSADCLQDPIVDDAGNIDSVAKSRINRKLALSRMNNILTTIQAQIQLERKSADPIPLAIVITKYDLIHQSRTKEQMTRDIKELFNPLFQSHSDDNPGWLTMICPVSLGKNLDIQNGRIVDGEIDPINVHLPLIFAIYSELRKTAGDMQVQIQAGTEYIKERQANVWSNLFSSGQINGFGLEVARKQSELEEIYRKMRILTQQLNKVTLFLGDREVKADV
jgi:Double-GTPase 2